MSTSRLDPAIHDPARLRIVATLAALPGGDALSVTRLQAMTGLAARTVHSQLHELSQAGYVSAPGNGAGVSLTRPGRDALNRYTAMLHQPPGRGRPAIPAPAPHERAADADRDAVAAALGEHFAQGRLTLGELSARLEITLAARTHGDLSRVTRDLPPLPGQAS
jgi:DNA-binding transcriptional ArsR family regulator